MFWRRRAPAPSRDWRAHLHDAERYMRHDNVEEAAEAYRLAAEGHPPDAQGATLWHQAGETFAYAMNRVQARHCFRQALALDGSRAATYRALAALAEDDAREQVCLAVGAAPSVQDYLSHARPALEQALECYVGAAALEPDEALMRHLSRLHRWLAMDGTPQARLTRGELEAPRLEE